MPGGERPQQLKPESFCTANGTTEVVPFPFFARPPLFSWPQFLHLAHLLVPSRFFAARLKSHPSTSEFGTKVRGGGLLLSSSKRAGLLSQ